MAQQNRYLSESNLWKGIKKKEAIMKTIMGGLLLSALLIIAAPCNSFAASCGCAGPAMHNGWGPNWRMGHGAEMGGSGQRMWMDLRHLRLDEKQSQAIRDIKSKLMKETISKRADVRVARLDLKDILARDSVDMHAVEAKLRGIESLQTSMRLSRIKAMLQVRALLTPEQRKEFREAQERHRGPEKFRRHMWRDDDQRAGDGTIK